MRDAIVSSSYIEFNLAFDKKLEFKFSFNV